MKKIYFSIIALFSVIIVNAQTQGVAFPTVGKGVATPFVTDYHCLGINVSGLGWGTGYEGKRFTTGTSEFGFGIFSDSLDSKKLKNLSSAIYKQAVDKNAAPFDYKQQIEAAAMYAQAGIAVNVDYNWMGLAFQGKKFGGIAFNIRENYQWYSKLNSQTTDLLFRGKLSNYFDSLTVVIGADTSRIANSGTVSQDTLNAVISGSINVPLNISQITNGSNVRLLWTRSYNIGYGRKIFGKDSVFVVYGGIGARLIQSMAMFDMQSNGDGLRMYSSISPAFNINYGSTTGTNPLTSNGGSFPKSVGNGYGIDLAASVILFSKLKVAVAVNNIGSVTYKRNVYRVKDTLVGNFSLNGLDDANITNSVNEMLRDGGLLKLEGQEKYVMQNAADFRFGVAFEPWKFLKLGFDMVAPFNRNNPGSIQNPVYSVGLEVRPIKWVALNAGYFGGGIYRNNIPLGITFILKDGAYECGIASRDALSFFTKNGHSVSTAFGFARFRF
ncbi:MAG: hypothetical protein IT221_00685 [Fluviicola sp.]|nr:hypothetical protein [Fluviicola sp.]